MSDIVKKQNIPTLKELVSDIGIYEKQDKLNFLMNQEPPEKWVKVHPYIKNHKYLPIDKVEYLLRKIFKKYRIEILREGTSFNGVYVSIRLHYLDFITNEWSYHDGIGAIHLQTKKGMSPADLNNINNGALSMAYPLAKTLAIKDAADMFGKLFGSDLNRRDTLIPSMDLHVMTDDEIEKENIIVSLMVKKNVPDYIKTRLNDTLEKQKVNAYDEAISVLNKLKNKS